MADTGASVSVLSSVPLVQRLGLKIQPLSLKVFTADGTAYKCLGYVNVPYTFQSITHVIPTVVVPEVTKDLILGMDFLHKFGFQLSIPSTEAHSTKTQDDNLETFSLEPQFAEGYFDCESEKNCFTILPTVENEACPPSAPESDESQEMPTIEIPDILPTRPSDIVTEHVLSAEEHQQLFDAITTLPATADGSLGRTHVIQHFIELLQGSKPKKIASYLASYRWSPIVEKVIDEEVERMRKLKVVEECHGPVDFLNPILPIKKANGKWRICLDSRRLNQCTKKDDFPFPNMVGILQKIQKSKYFLVIDLSESYYQVGLEDSAKDKTAFRTNKGLSDLQ